MPHAARAAHLLAATAGAALLLSGGGAADAQAPGGGAADLSQAPSLALPLACTVGRDCFVQNLFDHDPGPAVKDYRCKGMAYDGHDGLDLRLRDMAAQRRGVAVLAAAAGTVKAVRDGVADDGKPPPGQDCGNGVVIALPGGWETQYCHMARGSLRVKPGDQVTAGQSLGLVGLSGDTQFPHVHLSVRQGARKVDPFAADQVACGAGRALWTPGAKAALAYRSPQLLNLGFAAGPPQQGAVEDGGALPAPPTADAPAIVAYVRAITLEQGDAQRITLEGPGGVRASHAPPALTEAGAQQFSFAGARRPAGGWPKGRYVARYVVERGGKPVFDRTAELTL